MRKRGPLAREYSVWCAMRRRCNSPTSASYQAYGGRGIRVCPRWDSFEQFYLDMGPRPSASHSIERIDNNGNYEPNNCRWATAGEQARNTRRSVRITFNGETLSRKDWATRYGISQYTIKYRIEVLGWTIDRALTERPDSHSPECIAKVAAAHLGKKRSAEARAHMSAGQLGRKHPPEVRARMSEAQRKRQAREHQAAL